MFISYLLQDPVHYVTCVLLVAFSICLHEFSHACTARRMGDDTAYDNGYLSLNPFKVMGPMSLACLVLFGMAWGAVPVQDRMLPRWKRSAISAAGPLANLGLAIVFAALHHSASWLFPFLERSAGAMPSSFLQQIDIMFRLGTRVNCMLFVFNMLPIPILDGWGVLEPFITPMQRLTPSQRNNISCILILGLWFTPLSSVISIVSSAMYVILI